MSHSARAAGAEFRKRLLRQSVEPASGRVAFDLLVEKSRVEFLEPDPESRKLIGGPFSHRLFEIFEVRRNRLPWKKIGAGEGIRTLDPDLGKVVLYP